MRIDTTGRLDKSFGKEGVMKLLPAGQARVIALQPDGKIVVGGRTGWSGDTGSFVLFRCHPNGSLDNEFGNNGNVITKVCSYYNDILGLALQSNGKIVVSGSGSNESNGSNSGILVRYTGNATSVNEVDKGRYIAIYPNPASDYIRVVNSSENTIKRLMLYTTDGKQMRNQFYPNTNGIWAEGLADGMYLLQIDLDNKYRVTKNIIIQKH